MAERHEFRFGSSIDAKTPFERAVATALRQLWNDFESGTIVLRDAEGNLWQAGSADIGTPVLDAATVFGVDYVLRLWGNGSPSGALGSATGNDNANDAPGVVARKARTSLDAPSAIQSGDAIGALFAGGYRADSWSGNVGAARFEATENWTNTATGTQFTVAVTPNGTTTRVVRLTVAQDGTTTVDGDVVATGGFRQTVDGFTQDNVAAAQTDVELTRATGRFRAVRAGSVTGVIVTSTEARTAGTLTVEVWKNTGLAGAAGAAIGLTAVLDNTNTSRKATTQAKDTDTFAVGDELFAAVTTSGDWTPTTADIRVAIEVES